MPVSGNSNNNSEFWSWSDINVTLVSPNNSYLAGTAKDKDGVEHSVLLIPAEIVPDLNRDGVINEKDKGRISPEKPYQMWVNDTDDSGDLGGSSVPGSGANGMDNVVNGSRDLADFFPLYFDFKHVFNVFSGELPIIKLSQNDSALRFVYTDLKPENALDYLTVSPQEQVSTYGPDFNQKPDVATTIPITADRVTLNEEFVRKMKEEGKGVILIEAGKATTAALRVEIFRAGKKQIETRFPIKVTTIDKMFRHCNLRPDGAGWATDLNEPENFRDKDTNGKYFFFVHGYNVSAQEVRGWNAETFKRMYWSGSRARFVGVTWFGNEGQANGVTPNYHTNVVNAQSAALEFANRINGMNGACYVAAHSLGNMLVSTAISDFAANIKDYYMLNAAVAMEAYDASQSTVDMWHNDWSNHTWRDTQYGPYDPRLLCSNWYQLFDANDDRSKLTWRGRLSNMRGTRYFNFYSASENILANHTDRVPSVEEALFEEIMAFFFSENATALLGRYSWAYQEKLKGMTMAPILGSTYGGWDFNPLVWGKPDELHPASGLKRPLFPQETGVILADVTQLKEKPFFNQNEGQLFGANGSQYARDHRNRLLAAMVPATSNAVGANETLIFGADNNFNMPTEFQNGWPSSRNGDWLHGDLKTVAYPYNRSLYLKMVTLGGLSR
jgi:hypothetical protein